MLEPTTEPLDARFRAFPDAGITVGEVAATGWTVADLMLPAVTLRESALEHNITRMADWCAERGASLAPHGKTTMAPQLFDRQLAAGAWGITAATMSQVRLMRAFGVPRVLLANQVIDAPGLRWLAAELGRDPGFGFLCVVDSVECVELMEAALADAGAARRVDVLVELGVPGRRTGVRDPADLVALAERVAGSRWLAPAGVEGYEGVLPQGRDPAAVRRVDDFLARLVEAVHALDGRGLFRDRDEVVVTAGGSAFFDRVVAAVGRISGTSVPVRAVLRSGGYVTHDHVCYERSSPLRSDAAGPGERLRPALELWARVLSTPETGLAIAGFGKRDAPYDLDLPVPLARRAAGSDAPEPLAGRAEVVELNDQHAFLHHDGRLRVGDLLTLGLSHPCTAFDKWSLLPVLDDEDRVIDAVRTYF
ncbi:MAG TPA: amino acid deaminase [Pseudonocardia sp.]|nr:amino acid deaminase [Pseudonocardia sp.]